MSAFDEGVKAYWAGMYILDNPYDFDTDDFEDWLDGYESAGDCDGDNDEGYGGGYDS